MVPWSAFLPFHIQMLFLSSNVFRILIFCCRRWGMETLSYFDYDGVTSWWSQIWIRTQMRLPSNNGQEQDKNYHNYVIEGLLESFSLGKSSRFTEGIEHFRFWEVGGTVADLIAGGGDDRHFLLLINIIIRINLSTCIEDMVTWRNLASIPLQKYPCTRSQKRKI